MTGTTTYGRTIAGRTLVRMIHDGVTGRTFEATSAEGERLAVKLFRPVALHDGGREMLEAAHGLTRVRSPHLVAMRDAGRFNGSPFTVMELLQGERLSERITRLSALSVRDALSVIHGVALGLRAASMAGIAHGDVHPARILVVGSEAKIGGFGVRRPISGTDLAGTPEFMAPERIAACAADARSDLYSLGATLHAMLGGRSPFERNKQSDVIHAQLHEEPPTLVHRRKDISPGVAALLDDLLRKNRLDRIPTYDVLLERVDELLRSTGAPDAMFILDMAPGPFDDMSEAGMPDAGPSGVLGSLKQMPVTEIIQMLDMGRKTARVEIMPLDGEAGTVGVIDGAVTSVVWGTAVGIEAFCGLVRFTNGYFKVHYGEKVATQNVAVPTQFLLLEALRILDEESVAPQRAREAQMTAEGRPIMPKTMDGSD